MGSIRTVENIAKLVKTSVTTLSLPASRINIGAQQYVTGALTLNTATIGVGGVDATVTSSGIYTVYAVVSSNVVYLIASLNATLPSGFTQARAVGGFRTDMSSQIDAVASTAGDLSVSGSVTTLGNVVASDTRNLIINGAFDFWQRNTVFNNPVNGTYGADRWCMQNSVNGQLNYLRSESRPASSNSRYCLRMTVANDGGGSLQYNGLTYKMEGFDAARCFGKNITLSFWVRSSYVGAFSVGVQPLSGSGGTSWNALVTINAANVWEYKTVVIPFTFNNTATGLVFDNNAFAAIWFMVMNTPGSYPQGWGSFATGTANGRTNWPLAATLDISDAMLNLGTSAAPFQRAGGTIGGELALCQRYYERYNAPGGSGHSFGISYNETAILSYPHIKFLVEKRTSGSLLETTGTASDYHVREAANTRVCTSVPVIWDTANPWGARLTWTTAAVLTPGAAATCNANTVNAYLAFNCEL